jgi:hypothetical protein
VSLCSLGEHPRLLGENTLAVAKRALFLVIAFLGMLETHRQATETGVSARQRILDASYELFSQRGIRAVGINPD